MIGRLPESERGIAGPVDCELNADGELWLEQGRDTVVLERSQLLELLRLLNEAHPATTPAGAEAGL